MRLVTLCVSWIGVVAATPIELLGGGPSKDRLSFSKPSKFGTTLFGVGAEVDVEWFSPYEHINLEIWQGPRVDGSFAMVSLLKNASNSTSSFEWKAKPLDKLDYALPFHFRLQKGDGDNFCDGCIANSVEIRVSNIADSDNSVVAATETGGGLSGQDKLMIGLSLGIASGVIIGFITLMCCTQRNKAPHQRREIKRCRTPHSMLFFMRAFGDSRQRQSIPTPPQSRG